VGQGGGGLVLTTYHLCVGEGGQEGWWQETEGHPRIIRIAGKSQTICTWSDRASNYFVSGDDIKTGSDPSNTIFPGEKIVDEILIKLFMYYGTCKRNSLIADIFTEKSKLVLKVLLEIWYCTFVS
jgi:hypothetical protein